MSGARPVPVAPNPPLEKPRYFTQVAQPAGAVTMSKRHIARWDARAAAAANARRELPRLVAAYFARVRELLADNPPPAKLHAIRLETKRLRYRSEERRVGKECRSRWSPAQ